MFKLDDFLAAAEAERLRVRPLAGTLPAYPAPSDVEAAAVGPEQIIVDQFVWETPGLQRIVSVRGVMILGPNSTQGRTCVVNAFAVTMPGWVVGILAVDPPVTVGPGYPARLVSFGLSITQGEDPSP